MEKHSNSPVPMVTSTVSAVGTAVSVATAMADSTMSNSPMSSSQSFTSSFPDHALDSTLPRPGALLSELLSDCDPPVVINDSLSTVPPSIPITTTSLGAGAASPLLNPTSITTSTTTTTTGTSGCSVGAAGVVGCVDDLLNDTVRQSVFARATVKMDAILRLVACRQFETLCLGRLGVASSADVEQLLRTGSCNFDRRFYAAGLTSIGSADLGPNWEFVPPPDCVRPRLGGRGESEHHSDLKVENLDRTTTAGPFLLLHVLPGGP
ncbi:unnamed protein product [Echinostoma caproni]|uniref:Uncharacterized protein n=1 Tax=Echinostoma caproni TaxID=27848 RepID=A0A183AQ07_9TREM|nr:unnamed protein product [Echinostoma caproni]